MAKSVKSGITHGVPIAVLLLLSLFPLIRTPETTSYAGTLSATTILPATASDVVVLVFSFPPSLGDALDEPNLALLAAVDQAIGEMEGIRSYSTLLNTSVVKAGEDEILVLPFIDGELLENYDPDAIDRLRQSYHLYPEIRPYLSEDFTSSAIYLEPGILYSSHLLVRDLESLQAEIKNSFGQTFELTGVRPIKVYTERFLTRDMLKVLPLLVLLITTLYIFAFRNIRLVLVSWSIMVLSTAFAFSCFSALGLEVTPLIILVLPFNIGLLSDYLVHMFYHVQLGPGTRTPAQARRYLAVPLSLTAVTSIIGFLSLLLIRDAGHVLVGFIVGVSILIAYLFALWWVPGFNWAHRRNQSARGAVRFQRKIRRAIAVSIITLHRFRLILLLLFAAVMVYSATQIPKLQLQPYSFKQFPATSTVSVSESILNDKFSGTIPFTIEIDSQAAGSFLDAQSLRSIEEAHTVLSANDEVGYFYSVLTVIKRIHYYFNDMDEAYLSIPDTEDETLFASLIEQYLLFFSASASPSEYEALIDSNFRVMSIQGILRYHDMNSINTFNRSLDKVRQLLPETWNLGLHGTAKVLDTRAKLLRGNWFLSFAAGSALIFLAVLLFFKNLKMSIVSIAPSLAILLVVTGLASSFGFEIDEYTIIIVSITTGLTVDYTIHILNALKNMIAGRSKPMNLFKFSTLVADRGGVPVTLSFLTSILAFATLFLSSFTGAVRLAVMFTLAIASAFFLGVFLLPLVFAPGRSVEESPGGRAPIGAHKSRPAVRRIP